MSVICLMDAPAWRLYQPKLHCSLSVIYLAGALRAAGHQVRILDAHSVTSWDGENMTIHLGMLPECDVLGMSGTSANVNWGAAVAKVWPARFKVLGGRHVHDIMIGRQASFKHPDYFRGYDFIMTGECEETFTDFCNRVTGARSVDFSGIDGLYAVADRELLPLGAPFPKNPEVEKIPSPAFDLWEAGYEKGALLTRSGLGKVAGMLNTATMYNARGCPWGCRFCSDARTKLRMESLEQVEHQCKELVRLGIGAVRIADDIFTVNEKRAMGVSDILHEYGLLFRATTRVNLKNPDLFKYLYKNGCAELGFGVEHVTLEMLKAMDKGTKPEINDAAIHMAQDAGVAAQAFLIAGFPGETVESLDAMMEWIPRCKPDGVVFSLFQPYPGTDVWNFPEKYGVTLPADCFDHFWQIGGDYEEEPVLKLPTVPTEILLTKRKEIQKCIDEHIRPRDRRKVMEDACA